MTYVFCPWNEVFRDKGPAIYDEPEYTMRFFMKLKLEGKKALVTGSSTGIGESIAKTLAGEGVQVMVNGRKEKELQRVVDEIKKSGGKADYVVGDLSKNDEAKHVADKTLDKFGSVDILINNAGGYPQRDWNNTKPEDWLDLYNTNVVSAVRMINHLLPQMKKKGWGRIIQLGSCVGIRPFSSMADYAATKAVHINMSVSLALELAGTGITVNTVSPGPIVTQGVEVLWKGIAKEKGWSQNWAEIEKKVMTEVIPTPIPRFGLPEEVAAAVVFLASPLANYITATNLRVDGGVVGTVN